VVWANCLVNDRSLRVPQLGPRAKSSSTATEYISTIGMRSSGIPCTSSVRNGRHAVTRDDWFAEFHPLRFPFWLQTTVEEIDASTGRILDALKAVGLDRTTLVVFTSDNGPWLPFGSHAGSSGPFAQGKGTTLGRRCAYSCNLLVAWNNPPSGGNRHRFRYGSFS
jgi:membrane-anchored protein YejM (alkaline phosphatase superfamily)